MNPRLLKELGLVENSSKNTPNELKIQKFKKIFHICKDATEQFCMDIDGKLNCPNCAFRRKDNCSTYVVVKALLDNGVTFDNNFDADFYIDAFKQFLHNVKQNPYLNTKEGILQYLSNKLGELKNENH